MFAYSAPALALICAMTASITAEAGSPQTTTRPVAYSVAPVVTQTPAPYLIRRYEVGITRSQLANKNNELQMIRLQQTISQRQTAIQVTTDVMRRTNESAKTIAKNIR
jgi:hypothetical protein